MTSTPKRPSSNEGSSSRDLVTEGLRNRDRRIAGYRERALQLFSHVCGKCGREFAGRKLQELTVHHKDHNHDNNPPDGSNWELLCVYCHEDEHDRDLVADAYDAESRSEPTPAGTYRPFSDLDKLLKKTE